MGNQEIPAETYSDATLTDRFGAKDDNSIYLDLPENLPAIENTTPDISMIIEETGNILKVLCKGFGKLNTPRVMFTQYDKLDPTELAEEEKKHTKTPLDNDGTPPLLTQFPS